jgi:urease accessory protein
VSSRGLRAQAELVASVVHGVTRCTTMRSSPPLTFRATPEAVYLVGSAAGPLGGDALHTSVQVDAGARLVVRSAAATMAMPGVTDVPSTSLLEITVAAGGALWWLPEPLLLVQGCDHRVDVRVRLDEGATLVLRDVVVRGRFREPSGSLHQRLRVDVGTRPLARTELHLGPRWPGADGPAGAGDALAVAQTLLVGAPALAASPALDAAAGQAAPIQTARIQTAWMPLTGDAVLVSELARDAGVLARSARSPWDPPSAAPRVPGGGDASTRPRVG